MAEVIPAATRPTGHAYADAWVRVVSGRWSSNLADCPSFDGMVVEAMSRLDVARPLDVVRDLAVYGRCTVQAVHHALRRESQIGRVERLPDGRWVRLPR